MWWQHKQFWAAVTLAMLLAGCGFTPMYGEHATQGAADNAVQGNVKIASVGGSERRFAQIMKNALEDAFNPQSLDASHARYILTMDMERGTVPSIVRSDGTILRYDVTFDTRFSLTDAAHPKAKPYTGHVRRINSYNVVPNANFATYTAEQDLNERMLKEIAEDYVLRISSHLAGKP